MDSLACRGFQKDPHAFFWCRLRPGHSTGPEAELDGALSSSSETQGAGLGPGARVHLSEQAQGRGFCGQAQHEDTPDFVRYSSVSPSAQQPCAERSELCGVHSLGSFVPTQCAEPSSRHSAEPGAIQALAVARRVMSAWSRKREPLH